MIVGSLMEDVSPNGKGGFAKMIILSRRRRCRGEHSMTGLMRSSEDSKWGMIQIVWSEDRMGPYRVESQRRKVGKEKT